MVSRVWWYYQAVLHIELRYQENIQTDVGIQAVKDWVKMTGSLQDNDLLISGDVDELLYPSTLTLLRWCEVSN